MAAKVKKDRGAWWVITHYEGKRKKNRIGPTKSHKREAEQIAKKINAKIALGEFQPDAGRTAALPFASYATNWLHNEVELPIDRGVATALSPATAELHERHIRLYLSPFFESQDVAEIRVADVQRLYDRCLTTGKPPSERSVEMVLATLRRILAYGEAREEVGRNPVEVWKRSRGRRRRAGDPSDARENVLDSSELAELLRVARADFPRHFPLLLCLADTGARLGEATALRWADVDLDSGSAHIQRSYSSGKRLSPTKTGQHRVVELSARLRAALAPLRPDLFGDDALVFPNTEGGLLDPYNWRRKVFRKLAERALGKGRRFTPHGLRHTFASLHMARGTNLKWIQSQGGWASAKMLLDTYGHHLPSESTGYADALADAPERPYTAPRPERAAAATTRPRTPHPESRTPARTSRPADWWARLDSNQGPPACKAGALTS